MFNIYQLVGAYSHYKITLISKNIIGQEIYNANSNL